MPKEKGQEFINKIDNDEVHIYHRSFYFGKTIPDVPGVFCRVGGAGSHVHVKNGTPAFPHRSPLDRLCILAFNAAHVLAAGCFAMYICHGIKLTMHYRV